MSWAKLDDRLHDHPKVDAMLETDELRGAAALGLWTAALSFAAGQPTDGKLSRRAIKRLMPEHGLELAEVLVEHGLWDEIDDGWAIHDYLDYNPSAADIEKRRKERSEAGRRGAQRRWHEDTTDGKSHSTSHSSSNGSSNGTAHGNADAPVPTRPNTPPLAPPGGNSGVSDIAPSKPARNRKTDLQAFDADMAAWGATHFPHAVAGAVAGAVSWLQPRISGPISADAIRELAATQPTWADQLGLHAETNGAAA